jgi:ParB family chromosome partitioning protein
MTGGSGAGASGKKAAGLLRGLRPFAMTGRRQYPRGRAFLYTAEKIFDKYFFCFIILQKGKRGAVQMDDTTPAPPVSRLGLDDLVPYANHIFQVYEGERLTALADDIKAAGLHSPITVRPAGGGKYEILSGHNRAAAVRLNGGTTISAFVLTGITDEMAERIVIGGNMNQQSFNDWKHSQRIKAVKIYSRYIRGHSRQGARSDLSGGATSVHDEQKLALTNRPTSRDKVSAQLGISAAMFSRYKSIAEMDDASIEIIGKLLDDHIIGFMSAHKISQLKKGERKTVLSLLKGAASKKPVASLNKKISGLKAISDHYKDEDLSREMIKEILFGDYDSYTVTIETLA